MANSIISVRSSVIADPLVGESTSCISKAVSEASLLNPDLCWIKAVRTPGILNAFIKT